jgi:hypothetical protein
MPGSTVDGDCLPICRKNIHSFGRSLYYQRHTKCGQTAEQQVGQEKGSSILWCVDYAFNEVVVFFSNLNSHLFFDCRLNWMECQFLRWLLGMTIRYSIFCKA